MNAPTPEVIDLAPVEVELTDSEKLDKILAQQAMILELAAGLAAGFAEVGGLVEQFTGGPQGSMISKFLGL